MKRVFAGMILAFFLAACGGGGGAVSTTPDTSQRDGGTGNAPS